MTFKQRAINAVQKCIHEMYLIATPPIDLEKDKEEVKKQDAEKPLYTQHYLSWEDYKRLLEKYQTEYKLNKYYTDAYRFEVMNYSPSSDIKTVAQFWKEKYTDIENSIYPYFAIDHDGKEALYVHEPVMNDTGTWIDDINSRIELPKGSIKILTGKNIGPENCPLVIE